MRGMESQKYAPKSKEKHQSLPFTQNNNEKKTEEYAFHNLLINIEANTC
jgi:hypothetical protein